ncbi:MAG: DUF116 domain-containing protein [Clostridia bacterium]|nr:DUF116 domain-containing protein [Clostridia bacterium]
MKSRKRIFIGLISFSLLLLFGILAFSWHLFFKSTDTYQQIVVIAIIAIFCSILLIMGFGIGGLVFALVKERNMPPILQNIMLLAVNTLFPVALYIGRILGIDKHIIKSSFIEVNNQLVKCNRLTISPEKIMILAPHCLQKSDCPHKITIESANCIRCGQCPVDDLHGIAQKYGVKLVIASGGTLARKFIEQARPKAVIAIACERDLTSGIKDSKPLPVLGILNIRPEGPCFNTLVSLKAVEEAIEFFLHKGANNVVSFPLTQNQKPLN